ncbi:MAG: response regulator [Flavobacteriales bacterium]|uniref:response regulator n=1 Tax=Sanyastnella coralliicola TaxID=3069118 RepID=UPI0027B9C69D|nr:response regulator [Longitalea sp. SCSIO 12813]MCH2200229.1 response regulator [Flavobacteriales bacterium]
MTSPYKRIHLIDDDAINNLLNRQFLTFVLPKASIHTFQDARLLLRYLREGKVERPDLFLLDINMPELDGWEFLFFLEQLGVKSDVMILSSSIHWDDIEKAKSYDNVKCYIEKPLTEEKIKKYLVEQRFSEIELD